MTKAQLCAEMSFPLALAITETESFMKLRNFSKPVDGFTWSVCPDCSATE